MAALIGATLLAAVAPAAAQGVPQRLPSIDLGAGIYTIHAEVASTDRERQIGLMYRTSMPQTDGMLFIFAQAQQQCFWMHNTLIPLSAAFLEDDGRIVNVVEMAPQTDTSHCSAKPVRFVLEMNQNWFTRRGIKPGAYITGAPFRR